MKPSSFLKTIAVVVILFTTGCATVKITASWMNKEKAKPGMYKSVLITALGNNMEARTTLENDLANAAKARGLKAVKSLDVFPPGFKPSEDNKELILNKIREKGCDAIFTVALLNTKTETRYVPGSTTYGPVARYPYYGNFWGYYSYGYAVVQEPGYYTTDKTYFIESNLYDTATEEIVWSVQSEAYNPTDFASFSSEYTKLLVKELDRQLEEASGKKE